MEILFRLRESLLNIGIAGINLIEQDFRLKNNIEQLSNICENIPVLKKVYNLCLKFLQEENKITTYLDLLALIDAILTTQGKTIKTENLEEIDTYDLDIEENLYSQVKSAINAFTSKFSGRVQEIQNIIEINNKVLLDYRVINHTINELQDSYYEIPVLIKDCLIEIGNENLASILKESFNLKSKSMAYRLEIIGNICKEKENDFYLSLLKKAKGNLKREVIKCLSYDKSNKDVLLDLYKSKSKDYLDNLPYLIFSLAKIGDENDNIIEEILIKNLTSLHGYLKDDCIKCSCIKCHKNQNCNDKYCNMDCSLNKVLENNDIIDYLNKNIAYSESHLLANVYSEILEKDLEKYEKFLNLVDFIKKPIKNKKVYMDIFKNFCCRYSNKLETIYFKYLNSDNKVIQLLLSEMLVYNILITKDERFIELAFKINKEDKEEMFLSSYFLANLLTRPSKEVFEEFYEKVFPKKANDLSNLDKILYETKTLNLQMLLFAIKCENGKNIISAGSECTSINGVRINYSLDYINLNLRNLRLDLYENLYSEWFKLICNDDRLIFDFSVEEDKILFYKSYHILENTNILCKSNVLGFLINNSELYNDKEIGKYIYKYVLSDRIIFSLELILKCLKIINDCGVKNHNYLINRYLIKNLNKIVEDYSRNYYTYFNMFIEFFDNMKDSNFESIKNDLILQLNEELEKTNPKNYNTEVLLGRLKNNFGYLLN